MDEVHVELYNLDVLEFLRRLPDKCAAMVLTDPPYNIGKAKWDKIAGYVGWCAEWMKEAHRILKDNGVLYWWHNDMQQIAQLMERIRADGLFTYNSFCIWDKSEAYHANGHQNRVVGGKTALRSWFNRCEYFLEYFKVPDGSQRWGRSTGTERIMSDPTCWTSLRDWYDGEVRRLGLSWDDIAKAYTEATGRRPFMLRHYFRISQFELPTEKVYNAVYRDRLGFTRPWWDLRKEYDALREEYEGKRAGYESRLPVHIVDERHTNVFEVPIVQAAQKGSGHICEKPQQILRRLIRCGTHEGDLVVDPFMGGAAPASLPSQRAGRSRGTIWTRNGTGWPGSGSRRRTRSSACFERGAGQMKKKLINTIIGPDGKVFFECDRKACENCLEECRWTSKREHAVGIEVDIPENVLEKLEETALIADRDEPGAGGPVA